MSIATPKELGPKIVTLAQLKATLLPYTAGWRWGEKAIDDLWKAGAPVPQQSLEEPERRILMPTQFRKWWAEVQARMGHSQTAEDIHRQIRST